MSDILLHDSISNTPRSLASVSAAKMAGIVGPTRWQGSLTAAQVRARRSQTILTAVPAGQRWRLKAVHGEAVELLPPIFVNRLEALGAAVLLVEHFGTDGTKLGNMKVLP